MMINENTHVLFMAEYAGKANDFKLEGINTGVALFDGYSGKKGDGCFWGMKRATSLQKYYDDEEILYNKHMEDMDAIKNGEVVLIVDKPETTGFYRVKILGNFSDCCVFEKVCNMDGEDF